LATTGFGFRNIITQNRLHLQAPKFFCNGKEVGGVVGLRTKEQLKQDIAKARAEGEACAASTSNVKQ